MRHYVYISESKVNMMYGQINKGEDEIEYSVEGGAAIGIASGKGTKKVKRSANIYNKLNSILKKLGDVGDIYSDKEYISGKMVMSWNARYKINSDSNSTYWIGEIMNTDGTITKILLIGSYRNIIGNNNCSNYYCSTSYINAFFNNILEKNIDYNTLEGNDMLNGEHTSKDDSELISIVHGRSNPISEETTDSLKLVINSPFLAEYIDKLSNQYYGEYCDYEFTAKLLHSELKIEDDDTIARYVIATPIFVSLFTQQSRRIITVKGQKKYMIMAKEFEQYRKHYFQGMHIVLYNVNMKEESNAFASEMKKLYNSCGRRFVFEDKIATRNFIESATEIVKRYFYIKQ